MQSRTADWNRRSPRFVFGPWKNYHLKHPAVARLKTRCRGGSLEYQLEIEPRNPEQSEAAVKSWRKVQFTLNFHDDSGFIVMREDVRNLSEVVDDKGTLEKMQANEKGFCDREGYSKTTQISACGCDVLVNNTFLRSHPYDR